MDNSSHRAGTLVVTLGRDPHANLGAVSPPLYRASTVLFKSVDAFVNEWNDAPRAFPYGRLGTPTTFDFAEAMATLEGGHRSALFPSGLAAISTTLLALLGTGDHILVPDSVYGPVRELCDAMLPRMGIRTSYYLPGSVDSLRSEWTDRTKVVYVESPGSLTFEMQDVPAIAQWARANGARVAMDNSWATPLLFKPFSHGVDVSIHAGTKYIAGHSDAFIGIATATAEAWPALHAAAMATGQTASPDDVWLAQRGLRTLAVRLARHERDGIMLAGWLQRQPEVARVLHPGLEGCPGHAIWKRDYLGSSGLFGVVFKFPAAPALRNKWSALDSLLERLTLFGIGASWGGYESLVYPSYRFLKRSAGQQADVQALIRVHVGLEDPDDLIADWQQAFDSWRSDYSSLSHPEGVSA